MVEYSWVLAQFGKHQRQTKYQYRTYTGEGATTKQESPFKEVYGQLVLGKETFREELKGMLKKRSIDLLL